MDDRWIVLVRAAQAAGDAAALARLFADAVAAEGRHGASRSWLEAISGFDANAVTG